MKIFGRNTLSALFITALSFQASANLISNGSFEEGNTLGASGWGVYSELDDGDAGTSNWEQVSGAGIEIQAGGTGGLTAQDGTYKVELDSDFSRGGDNTDGTTNSVMAQLVNNLVSGQTYELTFWYSARTTNNASTNQITAYAGSPDLFTAPGALGTVSSSSVGWNQYSYTFTASNNSMLIGFGAGGSAESLGGFIDNVNLNAVPEPMTLVLLGLGVLGLAGTRKRLS